ncbi:MAG: hypothetical protein HRT91_02955 [Piscirickettsiaceae bacterium]|nr:hypothetical protein [Piscirickettsiaceae bacterium]
MKESYVNLIPTAHERTHVHRLRSSIVKALQKFYKFRNLLSRGTKLLPEDI